MGQSTWGLRKSQMLRFAPRLIRGSVFRSSSQVLRTTRFYAEEKEFRGTLPDLELATGEEKMELLAELEGKELYEQYLTGPFGTVQNPVIVPSVNTVRIVGCVGGDGEKAHDLIWPEVHKGRDTICVECGQVFSLKTSAHDEHHEHIPADAIVEDVGNITTEPMPDAAKFWEDFQQLKREGVFARKE